MQFTLSSLLAVGFGGFLGATSRYLLASFVDHRFKDHEFPIGIFLVNILGCLLIGLFTGYFQSKGIFDEEFRLFLLVGLLGGFTTFSTFINDSFLLGKEGAFLASLLNLGGQVTLGLLCVWLGYYLVKIFI